MDFFFSVVVDNDGVKVFDYTTAITAWREIVSLHASSTITKIKGLFVLEERTSIYV
jgi:hypothetical protein